MYRRDSEKWLKHIDFIILDMICLQVAFVLAYGISGYGFDPYKLALYRNMAVFLELTDLVVIFAYGTMRSVLKRGHYRNFAVTVKHTILLMALTLLYLFMLQQGQNFSRLTFALTFSLYFVITYVVREGWRFVLKRKLRNNGDRSLLLVTSKNEVEHILGEMNSSSFSAYTISGIAVIDEDWTGKTVQGIPVVANVETIPQYVCSNWVDEVLVSMSEPLHYPTELMGKLTLMGVAVHLNLGKLENVQGKRQFVEKVGDYVVLTTSINYASTFELLVKRLIDIVGGLIGCAITGIMCLFVAPAIKRESPGPIFFSQERVGRNGKTFKMYKFRSMYLDAEERKAELMKDNRYGDGKLFKIEFDPRVIGNEILPDGTHKTGVGDFIRRTSIDEFPQFFNVLKGDMSLVGTRPPLRSETALYELHHRVRLGIKPGITGMWQVSGRNDITDFEEVVRLDREYIADWSIGMDIKILLKTVGVVLRRDGSM